MVSFAFLAAVAFSAVPSPLYGLYRARDDFSLFMVTVIYAVYAIGLIGALLLAGHLSDWYGRRRLLLPALGTAICSAIVFWYRRASRASSSRGCSTGSHSGSSCRQRPRI